MSNDAILVSLGHNSSVIATNGLQHIGYEQERIDRIKSSSAPPVGAIQEICKHKSITGHPLFATHWFDSYDSILPDVKYTKQIYEFANSNNSKVFTHNKDFTHHDAHAYSAISFYRDYLHFEKIELLSGYQFWHYPLHVIVADGFGNFQEVFSIYEATWGGEDIKLKKRSYGYENSLGLMYQYATSFCGMKMNQDEYKFLGYESKIEYCFTKQQIDYLLDEAGRTIMSILDGLDNNTSLPKSSGKLIDVDNLTQVHINWHKYFNSVLSNLQISDSRSGYARVAIGYLIQNIIEGVLTKTLVKLGVKNLAVAGGIFYNVKLNNAMLNTVPGLFSVVPLAGDQGASIGFYEKYVGKFSWDTLAIGNRQLNITEDQDKSIYVPRDHDELVSLLYNKITRHEICNLVTDKMEFGPRALGNTSSLFLPTQALANANNTLNKRNEVMPFAPMILSQGMPLIFDSSYRNVVGSDRFMIVTYDYKILKTTGNVGVLHKYPLLDKYSGRPQIIMPKQREIHSLLTRLRHSGYGEMIVNTSYNYHGEPIVFSTEDILNTHNKQMENYALSGRSLPKVNLIVWNSKESN